MQTGLSPNPLNRGHPQPSHAPAGELSVVLEADPMHQWKTKGGKVVGHPSTPGEELNGGKKSRNTRKQ